MYQDDKNLITTEIVHPCLINWRGRINIAEQRGYFNREDSEAAADWDMCACGEAMANDSSIKRRLSGTGLGPDDIILRNLGYEFCEAVSYKHSAFKRAREIISKIENRLAELQQENTCQR